MPTTITGTSGLQNPDRDARAIHIGAQIRDRVGQDDARAILTTLRGKLNPGIFSKGYLRLVNTQNETAPLEFKRKTSLQIAFQSNRNAETGSALLGLFEKAGYQTRDLQDYLQERGGRKIENGQIQTLIRQAQAQVDRETEGGAVRLSNTELVRGSQIGRGGFGTVSKATLDGEDVLVKRFQNPTAPLQLTPAGRLHRSTELTAAYLKAGSEAGIVAPTDFIVRETRADGTQEVWLVPGKQSFRDWALNKLTAGGAHPPTLVIEGLILPKASGEELQHLQNHNPPLTQNDVIRLSNGLLNNLAQLALRGFVHGDIKPGNTFFNPAEATVQFIDTGSLAKISKQTTLIPDTLFARNRPHTRAYTHPFLETLYHKAGFEQDLYSVGITILVADLRSKGQFAEARTLLTDLHQNNEQLRAGGKDYAAARAQVLSLIDTAYPTPPAGDSPAVIGLRCVQESFRIIETGAPHPVPAVRRDEHVDLIQNIRLGIPPALRTP
jgi:hypothetical protein